jgi:hypothetical protein
MSVLVSYDYPLFTSHYPPATIHARLRGMPPTVIYDKI